FPEECRILPGFSGSGWLHTPPVQFVLPSPGSAKRCAGGCSGPRESPPGREPPGPGTRDTRQKSHPHTPRTGPPLRGDGFPYKKPAGKNPHPPFPANPVQWLPPPLLQPSPPETKPSSGGECLEHPA